MNLKMTLAFSISTTLFLLVVGSLSYSDEGHGDIEFSYVDRMIEIHGEPVAEGVFPTTGISERFTTFPGFASETDVALGIGSADQISYNVLSSLIGWSDSRGLHQPNPSTALRIVNHPSTANDTVVSWDSGVQLADPTLPTNRIGQADSHGDFHSDLQWFLETVEDSREGSKVEFAAYGAKFSLSTDADGIADSDPFFFVFNFGLEEEVFEQGVEAFHDLLLPPLQPGDADQDGDFDQLDLVRVQQAAKYLSGQRATWGDGDWDGGPGGNLADPPQGDGRFDQLDIVAALRSDLYLTGPYAARRTNLEGLPSVELETERTRFNNPGFGVPATLHAVPEPGTLGILVIGAVLLFCRRGAIIGTVVNP